MWNGSFVTIFSLWQLSASVPWWWFLWGYFSAWRLFTFTHVVSKTAFSSLSIVDSTFWLGLLKFLLWEGFSRTIKKYCLVLLSLKLYLFVASLNLMVRLPHWGNRKAKRNVESYRNVFQGMICLQCKLQDFPYKLQSKTTWHKQKYRLKMGHQSGHH